MQEKDVRISDEKYNFHFRVAGVIQKDDKFLIQHVEGKEYYVLPGGHVELGESTYEAIVRELKEEMQIDIKKENCTLFCNNENFYIKGGREEHWIEYYFLVKVDQDLPDKWELVENDSGKIQTLSYQFVTLDQLKDIDLKPGIIKELLLAEKYDKFNHIINGK